MEKQTDSYTIAETFELPSKGLIYENPINSKVTLRSMTTEEEMKRLSSSETPYKTMSDIIESCMVNKPDISVYNMCLGDYQFLLHKLRIVTYGSDYKMSVRCPVCGKEFETTCNLDSLAPIVYDGDIEKLKTITLPATKKVIRLKLQTPRTLDNIAKRKKDIIKKNPEMTVDPGFMLTLTSIIDTIDDEKLDDVKLELFVRRLPMKDANFLMQSAVKLNESVGLNTDFECKCPSCGFEMLSTFRITPEFFGPSIN